MKQGEVKLGDLVKDTITGVQGVVVTRSEWLNGCETVSVQQRELDKDGKPHERLAFDVEQIELVERQGMKKATKESGGPTSVQRQPGR